MINTELQKKKTLPITRAILRKKSKARSLTNPDSKIY
jgi:hypothetical protein